MLETPKRKFRALSIAFTMKYFSEFGFRKSFLPSRLRVAWYRNPVYTLVGKGKHNPTNSALTILIPSSRKE